MQQPISKQELLSGTARIEDFNHEFLKCFLFPSYLEDRDDLMINCGFGEEELRPLPLSINKLLCQWLRVTKYFSIPYGYSFAACLFLLPDWYPSSCMVEIWDDDGHTVWISSYCPGNTKISGFVKRSPLSFSWFGPTSDEVIRVSLQFPFSFVWLFKGDTISTNDLNCSCGIELISTSEAQIRLLLFSDILHSAKDCARILREYLKRPTKPMWNSTYTQFLVKIESRVPFVIHHPELNNLSQLNSSDPFDTDLVSALVNRPARQLWSKSHFYINC
jgi:hypothetical protein